MIRLVLIQWLIDFIVYIPALFLHYFEYTPNYYYCQLVYTDIRVSMYTGVIAYIFPMNAIGLIYFYIVHCIKRMGNLAIYPNRQQSNQRDLTVLRQIIILVSMLCMMGVPATSLYLWYIITGYLYPLIYQLQWLAFAISLSILPILTVFLTRQLRELFYRAFGRGRHIRPMIPSTSGRQIILPDYNAEYENSHDDDDIDSTTTTTTTTTLRWADSFSTRNRKTVPTRQPWLTQRTSSVKPITVIIDENTNDYEGDYRYFGSFRQLINKIIEDLKKYIKNVTGYDIITAIQKFFNKKNED
ncbi:unnamed protein product [Adineta steineri]|uniref:G-protein coupled receptors family 1 profile domain-containing protein n=1 Tax=Adineta steineri TaxID=433720 RepID=A0A813R748_9BILA|nr:unnamed protein product [Adineta steineri]